MTDEVVAEAPSPDSLNPTAKMVGDYYMALIAQGMPEDLAARLTESLQNYVLSIMRDITVRAAGGLGAVAPGGPT